MSRKCGRTERLARAAQPAGEPGPGPSPLAGPAPSGHVGPDGHPAGVLGGRSLLPRAGPARVGKGRARETAAMARSPRARPRDSSTRRRGPISQEITYAGAPQLSCDTFRKQSDSSCANNKGITETKTNNITHTGTPRRVWTGWRGRRAGRKWGRR